MLSFSKIITLSAVAFGTLTQALPLLQGDAGISARNSDLIARCDSGCPTLGGVLVDVKADLDVKLKAVVDLTVATVAEVDIAVVLSDVCGIIDGATAEVNALASLEIDAVLKDTNGVDLTVEACVELVAGIVDLVFKALCQVTVVVTDVTKLLGVLCAVVKALFCLLEAVVLLTKVVFGVKLAVCIQALLNLDVVVKVLAVVKLSLVL